MKELPEGWVVTNFATVCEARAGIGFPTEYQGNENGEVPFCKVSDISRCVLNEGGNLGRGNHYISLAQSNELRGKLFPIGTTVFAKIGEALKLNRRAITTTPLLVDNNVMGLIPSDGVIDQRYLYHYMQTVRLEGISNATTVPAVRKSDIEQIEIPLAPLNEQKRIVAKLDELLPKVEACKDRLQKIPTILKRFRQSVLAAAVSGKLTEDWRKSVSKYQPVVVADKEYEVADGWELVEFEKLIIELRNGVSPRPNMTPPGTPILRISAVRAGEVDLDDLRYLEKSESFEKSYSLQEGDLLFTRYNGSMDFLGVCGIVRELDTKTVLYPDKLIRARLDKQRVLPEFIEYYFQSTLARDQITSKAKSSAGQNGISGSDLKKVIVALPSIDEQRAIVEKLFRLLRSESSLVSRFDKVTTYVTRCGEAILSKAFSGTLVSQDPTDEPASTLLERIRSAAQQNNGKPKAKAGKRGRKSKDKQENQEDRATVAETAV